MGWVLLLSRAAQLQLFPSDQLKSLKAKQFKKMIVLKPYRGAIIDREGKELAVSIGAQSLYADPKNIKDPYGVAVKISKVLNIPRKKIYKKIINKKRRFVWLGRHLSKDQYSKIKKMKLKGLGYIAEPKRVYPNNGLLAQVLGFVGKDGQGLEGLEYKKDKLLSGKSKEVSLTRDARGRPLLKKGKVFIDRPEGYDVQLTVDSGVQYFMEKELSKAVKKFDAKSAQGVVLDIKTGEILALANVPTYNPNQPFKTSKYRFKNKVLTDPYEPGSVIKTITMAAALSEGVIKPNTKINCEGGEITLNNRTIRESDKDHKYGKITATKVLAYSSNVGTSKIALLLGDKNLKKYLKKFGFSEKTGVELGGESSGSVKETPWRDIALANISFGHGMLATSMQVANAYATIANDGKMNTPHLVKSIRNSVTGDEVDIERKSAKRVISKEVSDKLKLMLTAVTEDGGTGELARVNGFSVAGKTGTAQKFDHKTQRYSHKKYITSFAGFAPADKPRFAIMVSVDEPQKSSYASTVAAPVFSNVASYILKKERVTPIVLASSNVTKLQDIGSKQELKKRQIAAINKLGLNTMPNLVGLSLREAMNYVSEHPVQFKGSGRIVKTYPEPGSSLKEKQKVIMTLK